MASGVHKAAVVVGINYVGQEGELSGCHNDALTVVDKLTTKMGYDKSSIALLIDGTGPAGVDNRPPTGNNIMEAITALISMSYANEQLEEIWFHYSGHGSYLEHHEVAGHPDIKKETEDDGRHETLVPVDWASKGMIVDDMLNHAFGLIRPGVRVIAIIDACHSETALDLRYRYVSGVKNRVENPHCSVKTDCVMISGCKDTQTAADAPFGPAQEYAGAMTHALFHVLESYGYVVHCYTLLRKMRQFLKSRKFSQRPQITCSKPLSHSSLFACIEPEAFVRVWPEEVLDARPVETTKHKSVGL